MTEQRIQQQIGLSSREQRRAKIATDGRPLFDSKWRTSCAVRECSVAECDVFLRAHYLGKRPAVVVLCLVMERQNKAIGCIVYAMPPIEAGKRYGGKVWELARLYILDEVPKNAETWLIAKSVKYIRKHCPDVRFLLSYADPSAGHSGTIYKAAGWTSDGMTDAGRKTPRCDYIDARTGKKYGRKGNMPSDAIVTRIPRTSKYRFILRLTPISTRIHRSMKNAPAAVQQVLELENV